MPPQGHTPWCTTGAASVSETRETGVSVADVASALLLRLAGADCDAAPEHGGVELCCNGSLLGLLRGEQNAAAFAGAVDALEGYTGGVGSTVVAEEAVDPADVARMLDDAYGRWAAWRAYREGANVGSDPPDILSKEPAYDWPFFIDYDEVVQWVAATLPLVVVQRSGAASAVAAARAVVAGTVPDVLRRAKVTVFPDLSAPGAINLVDASRCFVDRTKGPHAHRPNTKPLLRRLLAAGQPSAAPPWPPQEVLEPWWRSWINGGEDGTPTPGAAGRRRVTISVATARRNFSVAQRKSVLAAMACMDGVRARDVGIFDSE